MTEEPQKLPPPTPWRTSGRRQGRCHLRSLCTQARQPHSSPSQTLCSSDNFSIFEGDSSSNISAVRGCLIKRFSKLKLELHGFESSGSLDVPNPTFFRNL